MEGKDLNKLKFDIDNQIQIINTSFKKNHNLSGFWASESIEDDLLSEDIESLRKVAIKARRNFKYYKIFSNVSLIFLVGMMVFLMFKKDQYWYLNFIALIIWLFNSLILLGKIQNLNVHVENKIFLLELLEKINQTAVL